MPEVYCAHIDLTVPKGTDAPAAFLAALKRWVEGRSPKRRPWFTTAEPDGVRSDDGSVFRWEPFVEGDRTLLEFTFRHYHQGSDAITWSTQASFFSVSGGYRLSLRVSNTGPELGQPGSLLTTRPRLVSLLGDPFTAVRGAIPVSAMPRILRADHVEDFVRWELLDSTRKHPVMLVSPISVGQYAIPLDTLRREFASLAEVVAIERPETTFAVTEVLQGPSLSCFNGAVRVYMPGLRADSDPFQHPLWTLGRVRDQPTRMRVAFRLSATTAREFSPDQRLNVLRDERALAAEVRRRRLEEQLAVARKGASDSMAFDAIVDDYERENRGLKARVATLEEEREDLEKRNAGLLYALQSAQGADSAPGELEHDFEPGDVFEAVEYAQTMFGEEILILDTALESAKESPYARPGEVWQALCQIRDLVLVRRNGPLGKGLRDFFKERGEDYASAIAPTSSAAIRQQYRFQQGKHQYCCEEHLRLGGGGDPANNLRIYLNTDLGQEPKNRVVVGHVGRHLDVLSTN